MNNNKQSRIVVHIDRLILDGVPLSMAERPRFQQAIEGELTRLLSEGGISHDLMSGGTRPSINGHTSVLTINEDSKMTGRQIAREVYRRIGI